LTIAYLFQRGASGCAFVRQACGIPYHILLRLRLSSEHINISLMDEELVM
jgi:hypothetical protein